eukprot:141707-Pyramimonas_sp.AAC.1
MEDVQVNQRPNVPLPGERCQLARDAATEPRLCFAMVQDPHVAAGGGGHMAASLRSHARLLRVHGRQLCSGAYSRGVTYATVPVHPGPLGRGYI